MHEVGMYGGSFNPLHLGHVKCIIEAANQCKELHIIISDGRSRGEVDIKVKYRWVYSVVKHIGNVKLHLLADDAPTKADYTEEYWSSDAQKVKEMIGKTIDVIFCGDDYQNEDNFYVKCYPQSKIVFLKRNEISSTAIRQDLYGHWDWLPQVVRPYYTKKVLLAGGESTGKSTLTINLANYYNAGFIDEAGRDLSEKSGTDQLMLPEDFREILLIHKLNEIKALEQGHKLLFVDTDAMITKFYNRFLEVPEKERRKNDMLADAITQINHYDLILFLEPDVAFVQDGDRSIEIKNNRVKYSNQIKTILEEAGMAYECISGDYQTRFEKAVKLIDQLLK